MEDVCEIDGEHRVERRHLERTLYNGVERFAHIRCVQCGRFEERDTILRWRVEFNHSCQQAQTRAHTCEHNGFVCGYSTNVAEIALVSYHHNLTVRVLPGYEVSARERLDQVETTLAA